MSLFILIPSVIDRNVHMKTCLERMKQSNSPNIAFKHQFHLYLQQLCNVGCTKYNTNALGIGNTLKRQSEPDKIAIVPNPDKTPKWVLFKYNFCLAIRPGLETWIYYIVFQRSHGANVQVYTILRRRSVKINVDR